METYKIPGFFSGDIKIYQYPSSTPSKKVLLVLKGIYGEHVPNSDLWDNALIELLQSDYHIIFVRTSRLDEKVDLAAFVGKTFKQESDEVSNAFKYCKKNIFSKDFTWDCLGVSLGGTILLAIPEILSQMKLTVMVGSGCGRNPETTKPLLSTLPETEQLLQSLDNYHNDFIFLHGESDTIVPIDSQKMIYNRAAINSAKHEWVSLPNLDHGLREINTKESHMAEIVAKYLRNNP